MTKILYESILKKLSTCAIQAHITHDTDEMKKETARIFGEVVDKSPVKNLPFI